MGEGTQQSFIGGIYPEVQPITFLFAIFDRKDTLLVGIPINDKWYPPVIFQLQINSYVKASPILLCHSSLLALLIYAATQVLGKTRSILGNPCIPQNAYCSRDIYFQFNKVCRSVISCGDDMKAPQRLPALNALGCSLI